MSISCCPLVHFCLNTRVSLKLSRATLPQHPHGIYRWQHLSHPGQIWDGGCFDFQRKPVFGRGSYQWRRRTGTSSILRPGMSPLLVQVTENLILLDVGCHTLDPPCKVREFLRKGLPQARFSDLDEAAGVYKLGLRHMMNPWTMGMVSLYI